MAKRIKVTRSESTKAVNKALSQRDAQIRLSDGQSRAIAESSKPKRSENTK